jgi:hypothetical protein
VKTKGPTGEVEYSARDGGGVGTRSFQSPTTEMLETKGSTAFHADLQQMLARPHKNAVLDLTEHHNTPLKLHRSAAYEQRV